MGSAPPLAGRMTIPRPAPDLKLKLLRPLLRGSLHECLPRSGVSQKVPAFLDANRKADVTFVQLLGHGTQFEGRNHVRHADAKLQSEFDILSDTDPIKSVIKTIRAKSRASHVVIDACRDNPLAYAPPSSANRPYARRSGR